MVFDPTETYLYSADMGANKIWTHKKDPETGTLAFVDSVEAPGPGDHPRWVEIHPSGKYLYALMEAGNRLAEYVIDEKTHKPVFTHKIYPLIPPGTYYKRNVKYKPIKHIFFYLHQTNPPPPHRRRRVKEIPLRRRLH